MEPTLKPKRTKSPEQALRALMRLCARTEKSSGDARRLMRGWGVPTEEAEKVLQSLIEQRFIDDERYAAAFVREKCNLSGWGAYKIRAALSRKEIDRTIIERALSAIEPEQNRERLSEKLRRKERTIKASTTYEMRTKLMRYGASLGYEFELVAEAVNELLKDHNDECDTLLY